jgi:hypothetical protein
MATHKAAVSAQNLRKRGCAAAATATPTGGCTHGLLSCVCRVAPKGAARRALRGCSGGGLHGAVPSPGIKPGRGGIFLIDAATLLTAALGRLPLAFPALT